MGFSAVWISPVTLNLQQKTKDLESYHGYWQQDLYAVNSQFGTMKDLKDLSDALHKRDMYLMLDVVVGNMAFAGAPEKVDYSVFAPFNQQAFFHPYCPIPDAGDVLGVQKCWLGDTEVSLPDLRTEDPTVANMLYDWITSLVSNYSVDGIRIDSVANLSPDFLPGLNKAAGSYCLGEVHDGGVESACGFQRLLDGFLNFPIYYPLTRAFQNSSHTMSDLVDAIAAELDACKDVTLLGTFSENHDLPRFASFTSDLSLAQNILTFNILYEGIPVLYYGQEHNLDGSFNPVNREALWLKQYDTSAPLYQLTSTLNTLRTHAITSNDTYLDYIGRVIHHDEHTLAVRKGFDDNQIIMLLNNNGAESSAYETNLSGTGFREGKTVIEVISCKTMTAGKGGDLAVKIERGAPQVFYPVASLDGTSICKGEDQNGSGNRGSNSTKPSTSPELLKPLSTGLCMSVLLWIWIFLSQ
ncbi:hypothetical protein GJ744_009083 [Endocarpon pusillum]|uniref:alpha-amylase n=1 Tax=Endocarpon pusillum TaxID=364733 RepID=A0A8H7AJG1_9EURO|nr:hypothetical protein GJ744_009083 [Endocarpon pusillum]